VRTHLGTKMLCCAMLWYAMLCYDMFGEQCQGFHRARFRTLLGQNLGFSL